jgi:predicted transcriptional regulator
MAEQDRLLIQMTAKLAQSYVAGNKIARDDLPALIADLHRTLVALENPQPQEEQEPAVSVRRSVRKDRLICLECGKPCKILKRHLRTAHGLTVEEYRERWNLPPDYPMVAADYSAQRSNMAVKIGLGKQPGK